MPQSKTLQGIFPEPKVIHKRNFIKENVRQIKEMQGFLQHMGNVNRPSTNRLRNEDKYRNVPPKVHTHLTRSLSNPTQNQVGQSPSEEHSINQRSNRSFVKSKTPQKQKLEIRQLRNAGQIEQQPRKSFSNSTEDRISHRGIQTERTDDSNKLYETGVIKYPSPSVLNDLKSARSPKIKSPRRLSISQDQGDSPTRSAGDKLEQLDIEDDKPDFIRANMIAIKAKSGQKQTTAVDKTKLPANYQKGVVPKYIKERKDEINKEFAEDDDECKPGLVLLPEEERKDTLRVLRQSYADKIQELNSMPVRSDTLKMQKRKHDLEQEMRKIDAGLKVFAMPRVFVKI